MDAASVQAITSGRLITVQQAAKKYGVPAPTIYYWVRQGLVAKVASYKRVLVYDDQIAAAVKIYSPRAKK